MPCASGARSGPAMGPDAAASLSRSLAAGTFRGVFPARNSRGNYYLPRYGTEFGIDVLLTCQGAPSLPRWRGTPLMKNVFDFAMHPALLAELCPRTVFEVGSGLGASAAWFADSLAACGVESRVHSVDRVKVEQEHPRVSYHQGDCSDPEGLFDVGPAALGTASLACRRGRAPQRGRSSTTFTSSSCPATISWSKTAR